MKLFCIYRGGDAELSHHGILGQKWGIRRFQYEDGSLTPAGKERYGKGSPRDAKSEAKAKHKKEMRSKVSAYEKAFNKASEMEDAADEEWAKTKEMHKALGKTIFGRINEVSKAQVGKGSEAAKEYLKQFDKAEIMSDQAERAWKEAMDKRQELGKNWLTQTINAIRYDPDRK